jgi:hypothetical protein
MKSIQVAVLIGMLALSGVAQAHPHMRNFRTRYESQQIPLDKIGSQLAQVYNLDYFREVRIEVIFSAPEVPDHLIVYLFPLSVHRFEIDYIGLDADYNFTENHQRNYRPTNSDNAQTPSTGALQARCPDPSVQFIAFAPNDNDLEQQVTTEVANFASSHGLKTISLLKNDATRANYVNYMSCPNLVGNFYDGDANPNEIVTVDGTLSAQDIEGSLAGAFRNHVTNIWLACEAFNDPMLSAMTSVAGSQVYAAGINDLLVGPSDKTAACTMEAAISGKPMSQAFADCQKQLDDPQDHWGFKVQGSETFGQ